MNLAIFASGNGSNAQNIIEYFAGSKDIIISLVLSDKKDSFVLERARKLNVANFAFTSTELNNTTIVQEKLKENDIGFIVLAGFMIKIPDNLIKLYSGRIINIHPALLPKYGGKGMYGMHVHTAVIEAKEKESGITIHYVNERYDEGKIIFQSKCPVDNSETPESLAAKVHELEYKFYPEIIQKVIIEEI